MELLIRSQDKLCLVKQYAFIDIFNFCEEDEDRSIYAYIDEDTQVLLGEYKTKERALEVLDEIQNRIHQTFICKLNNPVKQDDYKRLKSGLACEYPDKEFMIQTLQYELEPINSNVIIYEMPEE